VDILRIRDHPSSVNLKIKYPKWQRIILVVSRLAPEKRVDLAIKAFGQVAPRMPDAGMVIVGSGVELPKLTRLAQKLGLKGRVVFEEWQQDVLAYYKTSALFLHTSQFEGFGMALVEAAAIGAPIVSTRVGIAQDVLVDGRSALLCNPNDVSCLANKVLNALENPIVMKGLAETAKSDIQKLVVPKEEYLQKYREGLESMLTK
jgi:glycosyltransferase involved in cell wall biosynthesis